MTTKEEKARLKSIRMLLVELVQEVDVMLGDAPLGKREFITAKVEKPEPLTRKIKVDEPKLGVIKGPMKIGDLNIGDEGITIEASILSIDRIAGKTKAGNPYEKLSVALNDGSGPIKLVLWNEQIQQFGNLQVNDVIKVEAWKVEKGYQGGVWELVYGKFGTIDKIETHIM